LTQTFTAVNRITTAANERIARQPNRQEITQEVQNTKQQHMFCLNRTFRKSCSVHCSSFQWCRTLWLLWYMNRIIIQQFVLQPCNLNGQAAHQCASVHQRWANKNDQTVLRNR